MLREVEGAATDSNGGGISNKAVLTSKETVPSLTTMLRKVEGAATDSNGGGISHKAVKGNCTSLTTMLRDVEGSMRRVHPSLYVERWRGPRKEFIHHYTSRGGGVHAKSSSITIRRDVEGSTQRVHPPLYVGRWRGPRKEFIHHYTSRGGGTDSPNGLTFYFTFVLSQDFNTTVTTNTVARVTIFSYPPLLHN